MEQAVGELIDALSKYDRNARIATEDTLWVNYDGERCRLRIHRAYGLDDVLPEENDEE